MPRPEKGTPEYDLWLAAIDIAHAAPLKQHATAARAGIPWVRIDRLRAALDALGVPWEEHHPARKPRPPR